jgi:hypothetical protein
MKPGTTYSLDKKPHNLLLFMKRERTCQVNQLHQEVPVTQPQQNNYYYGFPPGHGYPASNQPSFQGFMPYGIHAPQGFYDPHQIPYNQFQNYNPQLVVPGFPHNAPGVPGNPDQVIDYPTVSQWLSYLDSIPQQQS